MATTETSPAATSQGYQLEGTLLEVCSCDTLCPCWIGEDPDDGTCEAVIAYNLTTGTIRGVDVSGLTLVGVGSHPREHPRGQLARDRDSWTSARRTSRWTRWSTASAASSAVRSATSQQLVGELVTQSSARKIEHSIVDGAGTLKVGDKIDCAMQPYRGPDGSVTTLNNSIFSTVPGSPAYVAKADHQRINVPEHGYQWELEGKNAIQSDWKIDYRGE